MQKQYDLIKFTDNDFELNVRTDKENETVWLSQNEIASLSKETQEYPFL